jgi:hypothetical protein
MNTSNQKFINLFAFALLIFITIVGCKNAESKTEEAAEKIEAEAKELKNGAENAAKEIKSEANKIMNSSNVLNLTQVDTPPLMDATCKADKNPKKCSDSKVLKFIKNNIVIPNGWNNEASFEQVLVVIEKDGSLRDIKYVASSNNKGCKACQKAAVDVVGKMDNWVPAMKDGKPVAVQMTIPVKFV